MADTETFRKETKAMIEKAYLNARTDSVALENGLLNTTEHRHKTLEFIVDDLCEIHDRVANEKAAEELEKHKNTLEEFLIDARKTPYNAALRHTIDILEDHIAALRSQVPSEEAT